MGTQRGRESFSANDLPHGKRVTRKRLPTPFARFHEEISGRVLSGFNSSPVVTGLLMLDGRRCRRR